MSDEEDLTRLRPYAAEDEEGTAALAEDVTQPGFLPPDVPPLNTVNVEPSVGSATIAGSGLETSARGEGPRHLGQVGRGIVTDIPREPATADPRVVCLAWPSRAPLTPGQHIGQYAVEGYLGGGGLGAVYLARDTAYDRFVGGTRERRVAIKGVREPDDPDQRLLAIRELSHLAAVKHPNLVTVHSVVQHEDSVFIVMEWIDGRTLRRVREQLPQAHLNADPDRPGHREGMRVDWALAYLVEIVEALARLHQRDRIFCDLTPSNIMVTGETVKLIDLGAVIDLKETGATNFGTDGYVAPEVFRGGRPSVTSDLYSVGRTLLRLVCDVPGFADYGPDGMATRLPDPAEHTALRCHDGLYRFLVKVTRPEPARRFANAEDFVDQAVGLLREAVGLRQRHPAVATPGSDRFTQPSPVPESVDDPSWRDLPLPTAFVDHTVLDRLRGDSTAHAGATELLTTAYLDGDDARCERAVTVLTDGGYTRVSTWFEGLRALRHGQPDLAASKFNDVYAELPGELAPKLAVAMAVEQTRPALARHLYQTCLWTDAAFLAVATFGLVRIARRAGDLDEVLALLRAVPRTSPAYPTARHTLIDLALGRARDPEAVRGALAQMEAVPPLQAAQLHGQGYERCLAFLAAGVHPQASLVIGQHDELGPVTFQETSLRRGFEQALLDQAEHTVDPRESRDLIDRANRVRPWTWR